MAVNLLINAQLDIAKETLEKRTVHFYCHEFRDQANNPTPFSVSSWFDLQLPVLPNQPRPRFNITVLPNANALGQNFIALRATNTITAHWYQFIYDVHSRNPYSNCNPAF